MRTMMTKFKSRPTSKTMSFKITMGPEGSKVESVDSHTDATGKVHSRRRVSHGDAFGHQFNPTPTPMNPFGFETNEPRGVTEVPDFNNAHSNTFGFPELNQDPVDPFINFNARDPRRGNQVHTVHHNTHEHNTQNGGTIRHTQRRTSTRQSSVGGGEPIVHSTQSFSSSIPSVPTVSSFNNFLRPSSTRRSWMSRRQRPRQSPTRPKQRRRNRQRYVQKKPITVPTTPEKVYMTTPTPHVENEYPNISVRICIFK